MVQYANHPQVAQNAPNKGRYDGGIRNFDSVSYPDAKGGNNGLTIFTLSFAALPAGARDLIEWIRQGDARAGPFGRGAFDNNRISAAYGNFANHLPAGGAYQEYGYTDAGLEPGEQDVARQASRNTTLSLALLDQSSRTLQALTKQAMPPKAETYGRRGGMRTQHPQAALISGRL